MNYIPYRVLGTYVDKYGKRSAPKWFYLERGRSTRFHTFGPFGGGVKASGLDVVPHAHNDIEAISIIENAKRESSL